MNPAPKSRAALPAGIRLGPVYLRVRQLDRMLEFYSGLLDLFPSRAPIGTGGSSPGTAGAPSAAAAGPTRAAGDAGAAVWLAAAPGDPPLLCLEEASDAPPRPPRTTGLYHVALRYPRRADLARAFLRLREARWPFQGFADHGVSEAIYLADPEGNGLELYADRPRERWPRRNGGVAMYTAPLDLDGLVAAAGRAAPSSVATQPPPGGTRSSGDPAGGGAAPGSGGRAPVGGTADPAAGGEAPAAEAVGPVVGHIHLQVSRLETAEAFYCGVLGFEVTQRDFPGALFVAAGGYHHHLGFNVWAGEDVPPPPRGAAGLAGLTIRLPGDADLQAVLDRARAAGVSTDPSPRGWVMHDPDGNPVFLTV